ncbi:SRPBCC family protein [Nocardioides sp. HDW12B]|uniref:SRPBCC family protein n=1 Tax=Nocardioides sp. HDW12B TaxID=2714939 RepID=UPI00140A1A2E|nr:SRPBCC family protein [Nocardioides sp. HDW12B]QIK65765.1 SRPBCC family protein [Nocardioides sp. HDW12B]
MTEPSHRPDRDRPAPGRELQAEVTVAAPAERVWQTLTDLSRMPRWSPELVRMVPLGRGGLRVGQTYLGVNRRGAVVWPTRNVVREVSAPRSLVWDTPTSGARWIYRVEPAADGTSRLSLTRPVPAGMALGGRIFARLFLGGAGPHSDELEDGMRTTLQRIASDVEG